MTKSPDISFILPSCRPYEKFAKLMVDSIYAHCTKTFEIIYISRTNPEDNRLFFIEEKPTNEGSVQPINEAYHYALGDFICLVNDDFVLEDDIAGDVDGMGLYEALSIRPSTWTNDNFGRIPDGGCPNIPNIPMMPFPLLSKELIANLLHHYLLNTRFHHHYSDCWLAFFLYKRLGKIGLTNCRIKQTSDEHRIHKYDTVDYNLYSQLVNSYTQRAFYNEC